MRGAETDKLTERGIERESKRKRARGKRRAEFQLLLAQFAGN